MSNEASALSTIAVETPAESEYDAIYAAVIETARGRWFLDQFARRNRNADTMQVLAAIERLASAMYDRHGQQPYQSFRAELIEMAATIAQTRAEVVAPDVSAEDAPARTRSEAAAAAQRIKDVAWTMREHGLDPSTCTQIEALAQAVLSASWLDRPDDQRAQKLGEVLGNLEHRIGAMLDTGVAGGTVMAPVPPTTGLSPVLSLSATPAVPMPDQVTPTAPDAAAAELPALAQSEPPAGTVAPPPETSAAPRLRAVDLIPAPELTPVQPPASSETPSPASPETAAPASATVDIAPAIADTPPPHAPIAIENPPEAAESTVEPATAARETLPPPPPQSPQPATGSESTSSLSTDRTEQRAPARTTRSETTPLLPSDPLAAIKAMSEAERIALFM